MQVGFAPSLPRSAFRAWSCRWSLWIPASASSWAQTILYIRLSTMCLPSRFAVGVTGWLKFLKWLGIKLIFSSHPVFAGTAKNSISGIKVLVPLWIEHGLNSTWLLSQITTPESPCCDSIRFLYLPDIAIHVCIYCKYSLCVSALLALDSRSLQQSLDRAIVHHRAFQVSPSL